MSYVELINAFWNRRLVWPLTSYEADFYFYLLKECNSRNWTNPFKLPTQILEHDLKLNRRTICEIRNKLIQGGYIDVNPSTKRGEVTEYQIIDISDDPFCERKPNANRTQTERKPNANRTQTERFLKTKDLDLDKEIFTSVNTKKEENGILFGAGATLKMFDGINLDFVDDELYNVFTKWLAYKKERRETYKSERSIKTCYNQLLKFSEGKALYADYIVEKSIGNNWQGFFALNSRDIDFINKESNGTNKFVASSGTAAPKRNPEDFDEEDN